MGEFYAAEVGGLVRMKRTKIRMDRSDPYDQVRRMAERELAARKQYPLQLASNRERVHELIVEMLAYQQW